ncbi:MAG: hypothetical protein WAZ14_02080 [Patescibacteria group bacterium]
MQKGDWVGLISVGVILMGIGLFLWFAPRVDQLVYAPVEITGSALTGQVTPEENAVTVTAEIKQPGFVVLHEALGEAPGPIAGQTPLLAPGSYTNFLLVPTMPMGPQDYFLLLFVDDGDGVYEPMVDLPVMTAGQVLKYKLSL